MTAATAQVATAGERVKVLHLITRLIVGGAQDNTLLTVEKHRRDRYCVHVAGNPAGEWTERARLVADAFHPLPNLVNPISPGRDSAALAEMVRLMRRERFDVVHTHSSKAGVLGRLAARLAGVPAVVHTMHGPTGMHDLMSPWKRRVFEAAERVAGRCTDHMIAVSDITRRHVTELGLVPRERTSTIYSGIDFARLDGAWDTARVRAELSLPAAGRVVVFVGRLDDAKAPNVLVSAFARTLQRHPDATLVIVGEGDLEGSLRAQIAQLGIGDRVRMLGTRHDVPAILRVADVFALSSLWEGVGRALTEAMLLGVPVVAPDIYGIPEVVHHEKSGLLFPRGDVASLASAMSRLLADPTLAGQLASNGRALTRRMFDGDAMVRAIEALYEELLAR
ncbi:MAG: glycosyltransferase family 4 protein [Kofleriaceae bacterium]|nr:MAG: glycosyltransferase family 4 protein [Kofleriaceae bacterium]